MRTRRPAVATSKSREELQLEKTVNPQINLADAPMPLKLDPAGTMRQLPTDGAAAWRDTMRQHSTNHR